MSDYQAFLTSKRLVAPPVGFDVPEIARDERLFPFQRDITRWALRRGRAAIFAGTGTGKSRMQIRWADEVAKHTAGRVLILAPLAVAQQTAREGASIGVPVAYVKDQSEAGAADSAIVITNYDRLHLFDASRYIGIVLDESSILKAYDGKTRTRIIESFSRTPYRLACTATPAPNDYMELGNHAEFLGIMARVEMLAMFFTHDGGDTQIWRLKGHAQSEFWRWMASWSVMLRAPSDLGYEDGAFRLPPLHTHQHTVSVDWTPAGVLPGLATTARTLDEQRQARRASLAERVRVCAELVNASNEPWLVWADLNDEADALERLIPDAVQVAGSDPNEVKEQRILDFIDGKTRVMVSKPSIMGWGLNLQHCANVAFAGVSHSFESYYQAVRRCWRFGQTRPVNVHLVTSTAEGAVLANLERKEADAARMARAMVEHMADLNRAELTAAARDEAEYQPRTLMRIPEWLRSEVAA